MTNSPAPAKQKKPLWRRLLKWTLRAGILLLVLGIAAYATTNYWASRAIHNEIARIRAAGEPVTFAELDALAPKVDRDQDAGPYYTAAAVLAFSEAVEANHEAFFGRKAPAVTPELLTLARRSLDQNRLALDLLDRGSALPGCNYDIQLQYGVEFAFPHMPRGLLNLASLRSRVLALDGQGDKAVESVISSLGLLRTMDRQPFVLDALAQIVMLARCDDDVRFVLENGHPTDAGLQLLSAAMSRVHVIHPRQMFIAQRVYYLEIRRDFIAIGPRAHPEVPGAESLSELSARQIARQMWSSLSLAGRIRTARDLPGYVRIIDAAGGDWPGVFASIEKEGVKPASIWGGLTAKTMVTGACQISSYRSALIALQIERFRLAHASQLPDSLTQLPNAADLPKDPFTGNPLRYVKTPDGYCVFSAGRGHPEDSNIDRDKDPVAWSERWGIHIRLN